MDTVITTLINLTVVPVTAPIPWLVSHGVFMGVFGALWVAFGFALLRDRDRLDRAWARVRRQPIVVQGLAWLLFLPVLVGLWVWRTRWPLAARVVVIVSLAAWNVLVMAPQPA